MSAPDERLSAVIATLYEPMTLDTLVYDLETQGVDDIQVVRRHTVNEAWNHGIENAKHRYCMVLNDDIEISDSFVNEVMYAHLLGGVYVAGVPVVRFTGITQDVVNDFPTHRGEAFSIDRDAGIPPIPDVFQIFYGDEWIYWQSRQKGHALISKGAEYQTYKPLGCGYSLSRPDLEERVEAMLGRPYLAQLQEEHEAATRYFRTNNALVDRRNRHGEDQISLTPQDAATGFRGVVMGLANED